MHPNYSVGQAALPTEALEKLFLDTSGFWWLSHSLACGFLTLILKATLFKSPFCLHTACSPAQSPPLPSFYMARGKDYLHSPGQWPHHEVLSLLTAAKAFLYFILFLFLVMSGYIHKIQELGNE